MRYLSNIYVSKFVKYEFPLQIWSTLINTRLAYLAVFATFFPTMLAFSVAIAEAQTYDQRVDQLSRKLYDASTSICEIVEPDSTVTSCGGEISIVKGSSYNAWAQNGQISLTRRLVDLSSDDELAFVIAHELAHVILGHPGSSIHNELEADYWAAKIVMRSGFVASSAKTALARLQTRRILGFPFSLLSHPANSRRMRTINQSIQEETLRNYEQSAIQLTGASGRVVSVVP